MGRNWMSGERRHEVIELAIKTVGEQLREPEVREGLRGLPEGEAHKIDRPDGPPSTWPPITPAARGKQAA
jgi:hypothetical protein